MYIVLSIWFFLTLLIGSLSKFIGGKSTTIKEYPYTVSLQYPTFGHFCGGCIIHPSYILTAAHCVGKEQHFFVKAGEDDQDKPGTIRQVTDIFIHPEYVHKGFKRYDIAVLELNEPLSYSAKIRNIKLPDFSETVPVANCTVTGWGYTSTYSGATKTLKVVNLEIFPEEECTLNQILHVRPPMFCAGSRDGLEDACVGDSGGPLVVDEVVYGIVSYGSFICGSGLPGVYTNVASVTEWIKEIIAND